MHSILFICTANQCRSPMAEALGRDKLTRGYPDEHWMIGSAGVCAVDGYPATPNSATIAGRHGFDLSRHSSRMLTPSLVAETDLLVTMEDAHKRAIVRAFPESAGRVFTLAELVGENGDVDDPIGGPPEEYVRTYSLLNRWIEASLPRIADLLKLSTYPVPPRPGAMLHE